MSPKEKIREGRLVHGNRFDDARVFLDMVPGALALWSPDLSICLLNESAKRLFGFSEADFANRCSLWVDRIYSDDKEVFSEFQEKLGKGKSRLFCDYRFFPKGATRPIWIREVSVFGKDPSRIPWNRISAYMEISDLKTLGSKENDEVSIRDLVGLLVHDVQNCIQKLTMARELAELGLKQESDSSQFVSAVESMSRSLQDLRAFLDPTRRNLTRQDLVSVLDEILRNMRKELSGRRVNLRLIRRGSVPMVHADITQLHNAFERVLQFCGGLLNQGGDLEVETGHKESDGELYAQVRVTSSSSVSMEFGETEALGPYLRVGNDRIRLGMALALEILRRYDGDVSFRMKNKNQGQVTILMKASPN